MKNITTAMIVVTLLSSGLFAAVTIESGLYNDNIQQLFINDFDLVRSGNSPLIYWLRITNSSSQQTDVYLKMVFTHKNKFSGEINQLLTGESEPFSLNPGTEAITNQDIFSQNRFGLRDYGIDEDAAKGIMDYVLSTGKIPQGIYEFVIEIYDNATQTRLDQTNITLNITDQITLDLIAPGAPASMGELPKIYSTLPVFRWESNASKFQIKICEQLPGNNSPEEVMNNEPRLIKTIETRVFQYPGSGTLPLMEGKTYFWQVTALVPTASHTIEYPGEIWGLRIANIQQGGTDAVHTQILNNLRLILDSSVYEQMFGKNGQLKDFKATGNIINGGTSIGLQQFNELLTRYLNGELNIIDYNLE